MHPDKYGQGAGGRDFGQVEIEILTRVAVGHVSEIAPGPDALGQRAGDSATAWLGLGRERSGAEYE